MLLSNCVNGRVNLAFYFNDVQSTFPDSRSDSTLALLEAEPLASSSQPGPLFHSICQGHTNYSTLVVCPIAPFLLLLQLKHCGPSQDSST